MVSQNCGPSFDFSQYTCITRKEAPSFQAIFMLFGSVENPFLSVLGIVAEKWLECSAIFFIILISFVTSLLNNSFRGSPLFSE